MDSLNDKSKNLGLFEGIKINSRYEILERIASGGMADVFLGYDIKSGKKVAIKILNESYSANRNFISRFKREAQILSNLTGANIVTVHDWGEFNGFYFIVMEYVSGASLKDIIEKRGALSAETAVRYCLQICSALALAHANNLIHRDIKPQNIMITDDGIIKVADFGIAKSTADDLTKTISVFGTAHYVSPEQAQGKVLDERADIYSLGIVMYEMITADVPFRGGSPIDISLRHINEIPQSPSKLVREIPENLEKIVMRCLEKNPEDRYRSVEQLKDDLNNFLDGKPVATDKISRNGNKKTVTFTGLKTYWGQDSRLEKILKKYDRTNKRIRALLIFTNSLFFTAAVTFLILFIFSSIRLNNISALNLNVEIPDVVGTEFKSAKSLISLYGLDIEVEKNVYHNSIPANHIISQKPAAGTTTRGATILVTVSRGKEILLATVPDLQGMKKSDAIGALENLGLLPGNINEEFSETVEENKVIDQEPDAGTSVEQDTEIKFTVSKGKQLITIPNIIGYDYAYAGLNLESLGLFTVFKMKTDLTVQPGTVIAVEPVGGSQVYKNSTVVVFISTSQQLATVPELNGMDLEKAVQALGDAGIEYEIAYIKVDYSIQRNSIVAQFPEPGDQIAQNEKIILFVGQ